MAARVPSLPSSCETASAVGLLSLGARTDVLSCRSSLQGWILGRRLMGVSRRRESLTRNWSSAAGVGGSRRRTRLSIVREAEACSRPGEIGALWRREGCIARIWGKWREQRDQGALGVLEPKPRGPPGPSSDAVENVKLRRELDRSRSDLQTARWVIEVQGNVSALLEERLSKSATPIDDAPRQR